MKKTTNHSKPSRAYGKTIHKPVLPEDDGYNALLRLALEKVGDNIWEHHFVRNETLFSASVKRFLGKDYKDLRRNLDLWWSAIHPKDKKLLLATDRKYRQGSLDSHALEYRIVHQDGSVKWVLDRGVVVERDAKGLPIRIIGTHTDITAQKEVQLDKDRAEKKRKRELLQALLAAQEKERKEISDELHENICQALFSGKLLLETVRRKDPAFTATITRVIEYLNASMEHIKAINFAISSSTLNMIGLPLALRDLAAKFGSDKNLQITVCSERFTNDDRINALKMLMIYRVAQEQLLNIALHGKASQVWIDLRTTKNDLVLSIADDGIAFRRAGIPKGLSFKNIENRVESVSGAIRISAYLKKGCHLRIKIPVAVAEGSK